MTEQKKKVFIISDHPLAPSGVGTQTKYMIDALIKTGKYKVKKAKGGKVLKKVQPHQKGLKKLPTKVRNKMGYMKKGGKVGMGKAMRGGGCVR